MEQLILVVPVEVQPLKSQSQSGRKMNHPEFTGTLKTTRSPLQTLRFLTGKKDNRNIKVISNGGGVEKEFYDN